MRNRIHRNNQRSYKYQEQERIPECFVDEDPYYFVDEDPYYHGYNVRDIVYSDCESVDSYIIECEKKYKKRAKTKKKSLASPKNRFASLDMEESYTLLGEDNEKQGTYLDRGEKEAEATILNSKCKEETKVDESEKCLKPTMTDETIDAVKRQKLKKTQEWIESWSKNDDVDENWLVITVDGFFRKKRTAGYGVMVRDRYGVPILASAYIVKPVSYIYHALQGINRGLELALKYGFHEVHLFYTLPHSIDRLIQDFFKSSSSEYTYGDYRYSGLMNYCEREDEFQLVSPLFGEIEQKFRMFGYSSKCFISDPPHLYCTNTKRRYNIPADYLAKLQVTKKEMKPEEFSEELKDILYTDAHTWEMMVYAGFDRRRCSIFPRSMSD